ncbi:MAG: hypothetical protein VX640_06465 [Pseudomonadota bacterium]|nr:hypothetical protein [Pseudomonadota bacterium]
MRRWQAISLAGCLIGFAASAGGAAAAAADPFAAYAKCAAIVADEERLACFDGLAPAMQAAEGDVRNALALSKATGDLEAKRAEAFGAETFADKDAVNELEKLSRINAGVAEMQMMEDRRLKITLDNGQVWRQDPDDKIIPAPKDGVERTAEIRRAMFGRYLMTIEPEGRTIRVKRAE